ncbi:hypothetical protein ACC760_40150, partial [Rhizobium ruizarguesonis]
LGFGSQWTRLIERMMLVFLAGILLLIFFGGAAGIKDRWLVPMLFILPLYFSQKRCGRVMTSATDAVSTSRQSKIRG